MVEVSGSGSNQKMHRINSPESVTAETRDTQLKAIGFRKYRWCANDKTPPASYDILCVHRFWIRGTNSKILTAHLGSACKIFCAVPFYG